MKSNDLDVIKCFNWVVFLTGFEENARLPKENKDFIEFRIFLEVVDMFLLFLINFFFFYKFVIKK